MKKNERVTPIFWTLSQAYVTGIFYVAAYDAKDFKGSFNIYVNKILAFFDHPPTPSKQRQ